MTIKPETLSAGSWQPEMLASALDSSGAAAATPGLGEKDVHVWAVLLDVEPSTRSKLEGLLSQSERDRAERFRFEIHRHRFIAGRAAMRCLLSAYLNTDPAELVFNYGPNGKPRLSTGQVADELHFNLAHSEDLALLAVTRSGPVGVDVERIRDLEDAEALVDRFFSASEARQFRALGREVQPAAFFNLWTRKEAWLKATGEGIGHSLNRVEVSFIPGTPARLEHLPPDLGRLGEWSLQALAPSPGFTGALAVHGAKPKLDCRRWVWPIAGQGGTNLKTSI